MPYIYLFKVYNSVIFFGLVNVFSLLFFFPFIFINSVIFNVFSFITITTIVIERNSICSPTCRKVHLMKQIVAKKKAMFIAGTSKGFMQLILKRPKLPMAFRQRFIKRARGRGKGLYHVCDQLEDLLLIGRWWGGSGVSIVNLLVPAGLGAPCLWAARS